MLLIYFIYSLLYNIYDPNPQHLITFTSSCEINKQPNEYSISVYKIYYNGYTLQ